MSFLDEVVETARKVADEIIDKLDELGKKLEGHDNKDQTDEESDSSDAYSAQWDKIRAHYANPKNGFVNEDGTSKGFGASYDQLQARYDDLVVKSNDQAEQIVWLEDSNNMLMDNVEDYKRAVQLLLDGEQSKSFTTTYKRLLNLSIPGLLVDFVQAEDSNEVIVTITQIS